MITYQRRTLPLKDARIPADVLDYYWRTLRYEIHTQFRRAFQGQARHPEMQLTNAKLARRLHRDAGWISTKLTAPSNMTLRTMSNLLVGMGIDPVPPFRRLFADLALDQPDDVSPDLATTNAEEVGHTGPKAPEQQAALKDDGVIVLADWLERRRPGPRQPDPDPDGETYPLAGSR